jgi:hypothetical protein
MLTEKEYWIQLLQRFLDTILFLCERGLAFRGSSLKIGDANNGLFLGTLELLSKYDSLLAEHLDRVKASQTSGKRMQVHYLSPEIQNEFLSLCAGEVVVRILKEIDQSKFYSIIVDSTPDESKMEQTAFIFRIVHVSEKSNRYEIIERFLKYDNFNEKTGEAIADHIVDTLNSHKIPLKNCRGQGYDNASAMSGKYKGVQSRILEKSPLATFLSCGGHNLNLIGQDAAACCVAAITFFGTVQKLYVIMSGSPARWEKLTESTGMSLHSLSTTRWSARIESVKPLVRNLPGIFVAIEKVLKTNLTVEVRAELLGLQKYFQSFEFLVLSRIWYKILTEINDVSKILQATNSTLTTEVENLKILLTQLETLKESFDLILSDAKEFAVMNKFDDGFPDKRVRRKNPKYFHDPVIEKTPEEEFYDKVFLPIIENVVCGIKTRFETVWDLNDKFSVLWDFLNMEEAEIIDKLKNLQKIYKDDLNLEISDEFLHVKKIFHANFDVQRLQPLEFINQIRELKLESLYPNLTSILRIFCCLPVSVAEAERSFSCLARIKNELRTTMTQERLNAMAVLCIESELAKEIDYTDIIEKFAMVKARKALLS